jgi:enamine deaminase RidA (YjgF/YER057c/UK114 family)
VTLKILQPPDWPQPKGYANGIGAQGRIIVTGGVVGWNTAGVFPESFVDQAAQVFANIKAILAEAGAEPSHLIRMTWFLTDIDEYLANQKGLGRAYREHFGMHYPAMAAVQVVRLIEPRAKLEIEATAVVPI